MALSVTLFVARRQALGVETAGPRGWKVTLVVEGTLQTKDASVSTARPIDFRQQHIFEESFKSGPELREPVRKKKTAPGQRTQLWRRQSGGAAPRTPFRLEYSFQCSLQGRPTPTMSKLTTLIDAAPEKDSLLGSSSVIETKDEQIAKAARGEVKEGMTPLEIGHVLYLLMSPIYQEKTSRTLARPWDVSNRRVGDHLEKAAC